MNLYFDDRGSGAPLLLLHGGTGSHADWKHIFPDDPPGWRVIAPDLRGHGRSNSGGARYTIGDCGDDVIELLDRLELSAVKAIGFSLGAKTLLHIASAAPSRIESMVVVSAAPYFPDAMRAAALQVMPSLNTDEMNFTPERLANITARTLIVHGDRDPLYPVELAVQLYRGVRSSSLWIAPNAEHTLIFGELTAEFVAIAMRHLGG